MTALFLGTTIATSVTGFFLPADRFMPSHAVAILSLVALAVAVLALYRFHLAGNWRWLYVVSAVIAQYFDVLVLVLQSFQKAPALKGLSPSTAQPLLVVTQLVVLAVFLTIGILGVKQFQTPAAA